MILFICFFTSCENEKKQNDQLSEVVDAPVSQKMKKFMTERLKDEYTFKNLTFVEGTLEDALQKAEHQNKYLYVITAFGDCSLCSSSLRFLDYNAHNIKKETFDQ